MTRTNPAIASSLAAKMRFRARGRTQRQPGQMNKLEAAWAGELEKMKRAGDLVWYAHEPFKLRLAKATFYTPDFALLWANGELSFDEVKGGFFEDDARVKIKVAARLYPFLRIRTVRKGKKGEPYWAIEEVGP